MTDLTGTLAGGLALVTATGLKDCAQKVAAIAKQYNVSEIVLGYPVNMNGTKGDSALKTEKFKSILEEHIADKKLDVKIILFDERLSTSLAYVYLNESGAKRKDKKNKVDMLSAQIILQNYIDGKRK